ncbi:hypothetical protein [Spiroplasma endosymbiont of Monopis laevigella]|uniref:hypothetical protein n=1 Tax=Spiroplasma endosymbiont of Monopis laevigella TaxID=3066312 RepID=UPI0030D44DAE
MPNISNCSIKVLPIIDFSDTTAIEKYLCATLIEIPVNNTIGEDKYSIVFQQQLFELISLSFLINFGKFS